MNEIINDILFWSQGFRSQTYLREDYDRDLIPGKNQ